MTHPRIVAARRSPVAPRYGALSSLKPHEIAAPIIRAALEDAGLEPGDVGEVICANAIGPGGNLARSVALAAGMPERVAGLTIDRQCAGGLDAIVLACAMVRAGLHKVVVAGGVESYSQSPVRTWQDGTPYEQAPFTPWPDRDPLMPEAAAELARNLGMPRSRQDSWAMRSHANAMDAQPASGVVPVNGVKKDSFTRRLSEALCARATVVAGDITRANMAVAADGAAFVVVMSAELAQGAGRPVLAGTTLGASPTQPGLAPIPAISQVLRDAKLAPQDLARAEIMEAFAVQAIACVEGAGLALSITNPEGGALARGHPIGASGAILVVGLFHGNEVGPGLAAIASAGGIGSALILGR